MRWSRYSERTALKNNIRCMRFVRGVRYDVVTAYLKSVMDVIKMEREIDPLALERSNNTDIEEEKPQFYNVVIFYNDEMRSEDSPKDYPTFAFWLGKISEKPNQEGNVLDLKVTGIKTECVDDSYDVKSEVTFDKTDVPIDFVFVKSEVEEGNVLDLHVIEIKTECMDHSYDLKSEMTFVESPVPIDSPIIKIEAEDKVCEINKVEEEEVKIEVTAEENDALTEGFRSHIRLNVHPLVPLNTKHLVPWNMFQSTRYYRFSFFFYFKIMSRTFMLELRAHFLHSSGVPPFYDTITEDACLEECEKTFKCDDCGKSFFDSTSLNTHAVLNKHKRPLISDVCGKNFLHLNRLKRHARIHTGEKSFGSDLCGKKCSLSAKLKKQTAVQTDQKAFSCVTCGKKFSQSVNLKIHERKHTGEKPYSCDICGKKFSCGHNLKKHTRIHTGEKPFSCDICGKKFSESGNLNKHTVLSHTEEKAFSCDVCDEESIDLSQPQETDVGLLLIDEDYVFSAEQNDQYKVRQQTSFPERTKKRKRNSDERFWESMEKRDRERTLLLENLWSQKKIMQYEVSLNLCHKQLQVSPLNLLQKRRLKYVKL
ncbi:hypothetical protein ANN_27553 [Periplaneta americana]|uniref:C2H2-type domain-containing protein n=1 Tax=Periplaneta americana TaxID=6978 RepID=A0ABQ8RWB7_PERAM|nr:hypothetical protein ANN_27553 [Periplaneta americana]